MAAIVTDPSGLGPFADMLDEHQLPGAALAREAFWNAQDPEQISHPFQRGMWWGGSDHSLPISEHLREDGTPSTDLRFPVAQSEIEIRPEISRRRTMSGHRGGMLTVTHGPQTAWTRPGGYLQYHVPVNSRQHLARLTTDLPPEMRTAIHTYLEPHLPDEPEQLSRYSRTDYTADAHDVAALEAQLLHPTQNAHRWGHDEPAMGPRGILADMLDERHRPQEAAWLRTPGLHVMHHEGQWVPAAFTSRHISRAAQNLADEYPEAGGNLFNGIHWDHPNGFYRDQDYDTPPERALPHEVNITHIDPEGANYHTHEKVEYPELAGRIADHIAQGTEPYVDWEDVPEEGHTLLNDLEERLRHAPYEEPDPHNLHGLHDAPEGVGPHGYARYQEDFGEEWAERDRIADWVAQPFTHLENYPGIWPGLSQYARGDSPTNYSHEAFQSQIAQNPEDWHARAVYADWLEEHDPQSVDAGTLHTLRNHRGPLDVALGGNGMVFAEEPEPEDSADDLRVTLRQGRDEHDRPYGYVGHRDSRRGGYFFPTPRESTEGIVDALDPDETAPPDFHEDLAAEAIHRAFNLHSRSTEYRKPRTPVMYSHEAFQSRIREVPNDHAARAVYADWLEDHAPDQATPETLQFLRTHQGNAWVAHHPQTGELQAGPHLTFDDMRKANGEDYEYRPGGRFHSGVMWGEHHGFFPTFTEPHWAGPVGSADRFVTPPEHALHGEPHAGPGGHYFVTDDAQEVPNYAIWRFRPESGGVSSAHGGRHRASTPEIAHDTAEYLASGGQPPLASGPTTAARYSMMEPPQQVEGDWTDPHEPFVQAILANPNESTNHYAYADFLREAGQEHEANFRQAMGDWVQRGIHQTLNAQRAQENARWRHERGNPALWFVPEGREGPGGFRVSPQTLPPIGHWWIQEAGPDAINPQEIHHPQAPWQWYAGAHAWPSYRAMDNALRHGYMNHVRDTGLHQATEETAPGANAAFDEIARPEQLSRYARTDYATDDEIRILTEQLHAPGQTPHRRGRGSPLQGPRGILADMLEENGREEEAHLLRTPGQHVVVHPETGQFVPGRIRRYDEEEEERDVHHYDIPNLDYNDLGMLPLTHRHPRLSALYTGQPSPHWDLINAESELQDIMYDQARGRDRTEEAQDQNPNDDYSDQINEHHENFEAAKRVRDALRNHMDLTDEVPDFLGVENPRDDSFRDPGGQQ